MEWENIFVKPIYEQRTYIQNICGTPLREKGPKAQLKEKMCKRFKEHFTQKYIHITKNV